MFDKVSVNNLFFCSPFDKSGATFAQTTVLVYNLNPSSFFQEKLFFFVLFFPLLSEEWKPNHFPVDAGFVY